MKAKIAEVHGMPAETQKLIAYGKVMDDGEKTVSDYKIVENGFIVVMAVKVSLISSRVSTLQGRSPTRNYKKRKPDFHSSC